MSGAVTESVIDGWKSTPLKAEVTLKNGKAYNAKSWKTEGYPIIRIQNLKDPKASFNYFQGDPETQVPIRKGDLVFSWSGSKGTSFGPHIWHGDLGVLNQHIFKVILNPDSELDQDFLFFALKFLTAKIEEKAYGLAALVHVRKGDLEATQIPLPPLPEQKKIAHILTTVQRAIEAQERILQTTTELKKALMHKLFTEGLRNEPQKQTEIGPVPESWDVVELVSLLREPLRNGHSAKTTTDEDGIRTLTLTAVTQRDFSRKNTKITCADPHRVRGMWLRSGDIFIERANTADYVGLAALYEGPEDFAIFPDLLIRVRIDNRRIRPKVLVEWLLAEPCRRYYKKNARSTAGNFPKIDQGTVEKTLIPVPSPEEQAGLENIFRTLDNKLRQHTARRASLQDLFRTLLHELMTAKTRVNGIELSPGES
ncbi:restriction endonuclease subunit S [Seongchinamella sediminis]|uniref:Restriction endonuclease subunit S n=1 Tax=Seongchinamella sediminis TaxID=2283635 RepID=A0A3L7DYB7_9GAMM|nr:restriction endonuclease subunit S [Seongchinamella sediminis]RLQ22598.1 restriction endonuclease subunit S [Seongchinamella sediminis]